MEKIEFASLTGKYLAMDPEELQRWLLENKVRGYNALADPDDGTGIHCPKCLNKGSVAVIPPGENHMVVRPCSCMPRRRTALRLLQCGMLERARECTLERFRTDTPTQKALKAGVEDFLRQEPGPWLCICGQSGVGKTHLCTAAFVQLVARQGLEGSYMLWVRDMRRIRAELYDAAAPLLERFKQAPLLYIDDLFKADLSQGLRDTDLRLSFELLDYRYSRRLVTILSTELPFQRLTELDQALAGRLRERCGPYLLNAAPDLGKNYRFFSSPDGTAP